ncbi:MAG: FliH/SctL family protein [Terracidiphilus sp.]|jgi:flagellar assembly protein FliH
MKNTSYSELVNNAFPVPVTSFLYRDTGAPAPASVKESRQNDPAAGHANGQHTAPGASQQEVEELLNRARIEMAAETEKRLRKEYQAKSEAEAAKVRQTLDLFRNEQKDYFSRVEAEVVHLSLAIAAKILHREAQVDPLLVAALVRVAVDKLHAGSSVSVHVSPARTGKWTEYLAASQNGTAIAIVEDSNLGPEDCILETDLGSANFSIEAQLKEVEQGFFDLLAQRPSI